MDIEYVLDREKLIPEAIQYANYKQGSDPKSWESRDDWAARWNKCFHMRMDELWEFYKKKIKRIKR